MSTCRSDGKGIGLFASQELLVRRRNCAPVGIRSMAVDGPFPFALPLDGFEDLCRAFGERRAAGNSRLAGIFQRLAVSLDGSLVAFEVSDDQSLGPTRLTGDAEGLFVVRADGTGLRRLGPASRGTITALFTTDSGAISANYHGAIMEFSPDGRQLVLVDLGPGPAGEASQVVTVDVESGQRRQLTRLPPAEATDRGELPTSRPRFIDDDRVAFLSYANPEGLNPTGALRIFTVRTDGTGLRVVEPPRADGSTIVPEFTITSRFGSVVTMQSQSPGEVPENVDLDRFPTKNINEVFMVDGERTLQLTNFNRVDTWGRTLSNDGRTVFLRASADPFKDEKRGTSKNPSNECQLFAIDRLGRRLRQLTEFREAHGPEGSANGCNTGPPPGCHVSTPWQDAVTDTLVFTTTCDPFGGNPYGEQILAIRPDGTGLRQLTVSRGYEVVADGSVSVELVGLAGYSAVY